MKQRSRMVADLVANGTVRSAWVRNAFQSVPRETFVPRFYRRQGNGAAARIVDGDNAEQRAEWLSGVYADAALVVQSTPVADVSSSTGLPTSSSSMPTVMAGMLEALDLRPGHRVLEIGTGTGYNAALLCERVGDDHVTTIELHPGLAETARVALASTGRHPRMWVGDGRRLRAGTERFDRIISTAATDRIPSSWIDALADSGRIVTDLRGSLDGGIIGLDRIDDTTVRGRFLDMAGAFMPMRTRIDNPHRDGEDWGQVFDKTSPRTGRTAVDPHLMAHSTLRFLGQLHLAGERIRGFVLAPGDQELSGRSHQGSWVDVSTVPDATGGYPTTQGGPDNLWDTIEAAHSAWQRLQRPDRTRFGVTATAPDDQCVWIDHPDSPDRWSLPL